MSEIANLNQSLQVGRKTIHGRLVIPSGIRCTHAAAIERVFESIPSVGIITTKSISYAPKTGYLEPIYAQVGPDSYINAVGLENPGAVAFGQELSRIRVPEDKFLLVSIFGADAQEFVAAAKALEPFADGFELNMSCPHAKGYGIEIGHHQDLLAQITRAVVEAVDVPVFVKLSATFRHIEETAAAAIEAGAVGLTAINTVGPGMAYLAEKPVLSNGVGGLSGAGIKPLGVNAVRRIRERVGEKPLIIGMGGIASAADVADYRLAGADFFGIGSALTGMDSDWMRDYLETVGSELRQGPPYASLVAESIPAESMRYAKTTVSAIEPMGETSFELRLNDIEGCFTGKDHAGRFYFLNVPGVGEKPFALFSPTDTSFIIRKVGCFTEHLSGLAKGDAVYVRGPYGTSLPEMDGQQIVLVGGGTGMVPLLEIGRKYHPNNRLIFFLGTQSGREFIYPERFRALGEVHMATDDGSEGLPGVVTELLLNSLKNQPADRNRVFINSGPAPMVYRAFDVEKMFVPAENIFGSVTYMTSCGVGICGKCATPQGVLSCVDGPFLAMDRLCRESDV